MILFCKDSTDLYKKSLFFIKIEIVVEVSERDIIDHPLQYMREVRLFSRMIDGIIAAWTGHGFWFF